MKSFFGEHEAPADGATTPPTVGIIGAGPFGHALAAVARRRGCAVLVWSRRTDKQLPGGARYASLDEIAAAAKLLLFCAPAAHARPLLRRLGDLATGGHLLVHAGRGFELPGTATPRAGDIAAPRAPDGGPTAITISMIVREETPIRRVGVIAGPLVPRELEDAIPSAIVVASRFPEVAQAAQEALAQEALRVYGSDDLVGVELAAALMTVVALTAGLVTGLGGGISTRALVVARGIAQAARILDALGARSRTLSGLGGIGEVFVTAQGVESPDFELGLAIARGDVIPGAKGSPDRPGRTAEGPSVARTIAAIAAARRLRAPLFVAVAEICSGERPPRDALREFFVSAPTEI